MLKDWDGASHLYEGTWEPYVRDFDPTLNINFLKPDFIPSIQFPPSNEGCFYKNCENDEDICYYLQEKMALIKKNILEEKSLYESEWIAI